MAVGLGQEVTLSIPWNQVRLRCDGVDHFSEHLGSIFELEPEISTSVHDFLSLKVHGHVLHGHLVFDLGLLFFEAKDEIVLHDQRAAEAAGAHKVLLNSNHRVVTRVAILRVLSDQ